MPDIHFDCPKCGQTIDAPQEMAAQLTDCPTCKETIEVPVRSQRKEAPKPTPASAPRPTPPPPSAPKLSAIFSGISYGQGTVIIGILVATFFLPFFHSPRVLPPPQWEYQIVSVPDYSFTDKMNDLGAAGWELVFARRASDGSESPTFSYEIILKRPKISR